MRIEISIGWDENERATFPNQHRNITLDESKPTIITGRNGSGKSLFAKTIDQLFSVLSTVDEEVYIEARKFFEDIGLSWANVNIEALYIEGQKNEYGPWKRMVGAHPFNEIPIPFVLDIISGDEESESDYCRTEYKIHATINLDNLNVNPQLKIDFSLSGSYLNTNSFPILNDEGEYEDEEYVNISAEYFSTNPFQTLHVDSLRTFETKKMFEDIDSDLLYAEIRKAVQSIGSQISRNSEDYGSADIEYYGEELDIPQNSPNIEVFDVFGDSDFGIFKLPKVRYLKENRPLPTISEEFASAIKDLVTMKSRINQTLDKYGILLFTEYNDYSIFYDINQANEVLCEHLSTDEDINTEIYPDIDKWFSFIPLLWKWNYTSFDQIGFDGEHQELNHQISGDEVNQFFKDIEDIFGPYEAWPVRNRFSNLQKNLNKLIQTQVVSKYLRKTSESLPGDADENLRFLEDLMMLCSTRSFIVNQLVKFRPILRIFEEFFSETEGSLEQSYSKFIQKINNPKIVPSGYKNLFAMALSTADLEAVDDVVYFLDEPEISLHVSWQIRLVDFLFGLFRGKENMLNNRNPVYASNKFFVVATHSPEIVSSSFENVTDFGSTIES